MIIACSDCGTIQSFPPLQPRARLICRRCDKVLERTAGRSIDAALALASATFILWFPANLSTLLTIQVLGIERSSRLGSGVLALFSEGWPLLGVVVALQGVILPFIRFGLLASALAGIKLGRQGLWTGFVFRWTQHLDLWSMPDVFLVGGIIGYSRIDALIPVTIGPGGWSLIAAAFFTMLTRATLDSRSVWRAIETPEGTEEGLHIACTECELVLPADMAGKRCPRCGARLWRRKPLSIMRTTALIAAGYPLYLVAVYFPMNVTTQFGHASNQTIMYGVDRLVEAGFLPLAIIIFCASIMIPVTKLVVLTWLVWSVHRGSDSWLRRKTRAYRFVEEIGRWSNIDIFTIVIFLPIMQIGGFVSVHAAVGAPAFLAVIVLTMFAARVFDPRLLWDARDAHSPAFKRPGAGGPAAHHTMLQRHPGEGWRETAQEPA